MRERLRTIVPELKITAVHGKMSPRDIDAAMLEFVSGESEVLITTNIIETGLDIPRANTIIVWRPDKFGLAQLHQLRGRVGRGSTRAFALFLTDPDARLSSTAIRRLEILVDSETTGAGLDISHSDMDLRGVGDLLSERQSGHAKLVGPSLLRHLLDRALRGESDRDLSSEARPQLHLERPPFLPTSYIQDEATRLETYARISKCASEDELDEIEDQMIERFGELPAEAADFLEQARMEVDCLTLGIVSINAGPDSIAATLDNHGPGRGKRGRCASKKLQLRDGRLVYERPSSRSERFTAVREFLDILAESRGRSVAGGRNG
jgi:transcription-repair coupling factor (superfamily II helicase)